jgi:hypothetical protein
MRIVCPSHTAFRALAGWFCSSRSTFSPSWTAQIRRTPASQGRTAATIATAASTTIGQDRCIGKQGG